MEGVCLKLWGDNLDAEGCKKLNILNILHHWGGGTEKHVHDLRATLGSIYNVYILKPAGDGFEVEELDDEEEIYKKHNFSCDFKWNLTKGDISPFHSQDYRSMLEEIINRFEIDIIHIHHLIGHTFDVVEVAEENDIPTLFTIHDFYSICPRITLLDEKINWFIIGISAKFSEPGYYPEYNINIIGVFKGEKELFDILKARRIHLAVFPALGLETYSYALSEAWIAGIPVIASDLGALKERVERKGGGWTASPNAASFKDRIEEVLSDPKMYHAAKDKIASIEHKTLEEMGLDYSRLYAESMISKLERRASILNLALSERDGKIEGLAEQLRHSENEAQRLEREISDMRRSIVWQLLMRYHVGFVERCMPPGTGRRGCYNLALEGGRVLVNEGFRSFLFRARRRVSSRTPFLEDRYHLWRLKNEPTQEELNELKRKAAALKYRPKISIITPVWNTDERWLRLAIESALGQIYDNWELCIADGNSLKPHVKTVLEEYEKKDPRIKVRFLSENEGIAGNSNEALSMASGEFVAFLDHDDELAPFALFEVVKRLNEDPFLDYIYSDEDKIDEKGERRDPFFKPDWSPDMFLSCNYLCHLSVIRKKVVDEVGGFRAGYDGSQDYDLFLRVTERIGDGGIGHIPKILYHWRMIPESAATSCQAKPYAYIAAKKALKDAMVRSGVKIDDVLDGFWTGSYRIKYKIEVEPRVSIIIPTKDNVKMLRKCVDSIIQKTLYRNYDILLIDNQSVRDETFEYYRTIDNDLIKILNFNEPFNYAKMNNLAVSLCKSEYILFLNNDIEVISEEWLNAMVECAQKNNTGAVGAKLVFPNHLIQHCGVILNYNFAAIHHYYKYPNHHGYFGTINMIRNFSAVTAACMMTKKSLFEEVGGFDEKNLAVAFNDVDYCLKLRRKGYLIVYTPYAELYHHESLSRGYDDTPEKQKRFQREVAYMREKWGEVLDNDPYYNPNLTRDREDFSIRV
jgi:GT2 family glycosyltransferase/glycosyltransferase involved in cell wall biosynthesis